VIFGKVVKKIPMKNRKFFVYVGVRAFRWFCVRVRRISGVYALCQTAAQCHNRGYNLSLKVYNIIRYRLAIVVRHLSVTCDTCVLFKMQVVGKWLLRLCVAVSQKRELRKIFNLKDIAKAKGCEPTVTPGTHMLRQRAVRHRRCQAVPAKKLTH
jgi:hypothetical protein